MQTLFPSPYHLLNPLARNHAPTLTQTHQTVTVTAAATSDVPPEPTTTAITTTSVSFPKIPFSSTALLSLNLLNPRGLLSSIASLLPYVQRSRSGGGGDDSVEELVVVDEKEEEEDRVHPYAFHVSGPTNVPSPNWKQLISSSWKDENYRRTVIACFIQAVYLLELDRQENRTEKTSLALNWWKPFKYKVIKKLVDKRDGSIFGALFEWDQSSALSDFILMRPRGAPRAVLALRGTFLTGPTIRRDIEDDLRFVTWESLEGSVRFSTTHEALKWSVDTYGSSNVCIAGHSLGAGFALQVGKTLAKEGIFLETHLFNPPSVSLAMSLRTLGDSTGFVWTRFKALFPFGVDSKTNEEMPPSGGNIHGRWIPHLYVNDNDYICCYYNTPTGAPSDNANTGDCSYRENPGCTHGEAAVKLFVMSKAKQRFLEAHGLEQWWSNDLKLQSVHNSKLISRQLESVYTLQSSPPARKLTDAKLLVPLTKITIHLFSGFFAGWISIRFHSFGRILWSIPRATFGMIRR